MIGRRAKIVCTLGPATRAPELLAALLEAGMDVARLNFSHGTHEEHAEAIAQVRRLSAELGRPVAVLQDLQGPKVRVGTFPGGAVELQAGSTFVLTPQPVLGEEGRAAVSYPRLAADVREGDDVLLSDGLLRLQVTGIAGEDVVCRVVDGGRLRDRAGVNVPGSELGLPSLTEKDREDLAFGVAHEVDYVALSFVRRGRDLSELRGALAAAGGRAAVVAKLEKPQAIDSLDEILALADAVMIARGDLGVEVSPERVPSLQKTIIRRAAEARVPVITATQMLESMVTARRPTRAEASDVANAVFDGTDAVMLSGETSVGQHPVEAVRMMDRIVREAESHLTYAPERRRLPRGVRLSFADAIADAAGRAAAELDAAAIVAFTQSGFTARLISKHRPATPIFAYTPHPHVLRRLCLYWGVTPRSAALAHPIEPVFAQVDADLRREGMVEAGDTLVFLAGWPGLQTGTTNTMRLHRAGDPLGGASRDPALHGPPPGAGPTGLQGTARATA
ncbi:MAG: pyruvate kinase [Candidatus Latescibacterota bacterium]